MQRLRVLPVALMFWWAPEIARVYARRSSLTTHPHPLCPEACEIYVHLITTILAAADSRVPGTLKSVRCHGRVGLIGYFQLSLHYLHLRYT
jgi:ADP-ribosylglycohydrolase